MSEKSSVAQRIVRAARDLFAAKGFADTKTRQIAAAAGTSESGVFRYFADKNSLMRAAYNDAWADLNRYVDQAVEAASPFPDPLAEIECVARAFWSYYERDSLTSAFLVLNAGFFAMHTVPGQSELVEEESKFYLRRIERLCHAAAGQDWRPAPSTRPPHRRPVALVCRWATASVGLASRS